MLTRLGLLVGLVACGSDPAATFDSVTAAMSARGTWMEDFVWPADAYVPCTNCEHLTMLEFEPDRYQLTVFMRTPGMPATVQEQCQSTMMFVEEPIEGFDPRVRVVLRLSVGTNTCGFMVGNDFNVVLEVVDDSQGASYVAGWDDPANLADPFPGYSFLSSGNGYPLAHCASAPETLCEPACTVPTATGCTLPMP